MRKIAAAILFTALLAGPAAAQSADDAERLAGEGLAKILQALDALIVLAARAA